MNKGVVIKVDESYAVVLSEGTYFRVTLKQGMLQGQAIFFSDQDLYRSSVKRRNVMMNIRKMIAVAACLVVLVTAGIFMNQESYASAVIVDINPSVRLELDADEIVINYQALNEDAETLVLDDVIGMTVDDAISFITIQAIDAGFLDVEDLEDDYVLITTISEENQEQIQNRIRIAHEEDENLRGLNLALINATKTQYKNFGENEIPVGLMVASENLQNRVNVREYFQNQEYRQEFAQNGEILRQDFGKQIDRLNEYIDALDISQSQKDMITERFRSAKAVFTQAQTQLREDMEAYQTTLQTGDAAQIAEAKRTMEQAKHYVDNLESQNGSVNEVQDLLTAASNDEQNQAELELQLQQVIDNEVGQEAGSDEGTATQNAEQDAGETNNSPGQKPEGKGPSGK